MLTTINDNSQEKYAEIHKEELDSFLPYCQEELGFKKPVSINFESDENNSKELFGKTAFYNPKEMSITIYTSKRHPKDVFRSMAHELVHHCQNCDGRFDNMTMEDGYAQDNKHLRDMEKDAYLRGNLLLRDFEDQQKMKNNKDLKIEQKINSSLAVLLAEAVTQSMGNDDMYKDQAPAPELGSVAPKWRKCSGTLRTGCRGRNVEDLQIRLQKLDYLTKEDIDGHFGRDTTIGVKGLQIDNDVPQDQVDGVFGKNTLALLKKLEGIRGVDANDRIARADIGGAEASAMNSMSKLGRNAKAPSSVPASAGPNDFEDGWDRTNASGGKAISPKLVNEGSSISRQNAKRIKFYARQIGILLRYPSNANWRIIINFLSKAIKHKIINDVRWEFKIKNRKTLVDAINLASRYDPNREMRNDYERRDRLNLQKRAKKYASIKQKKSEKREPDVPASPSKNMSQEPDNYTPYDYDDKVRYDDKIRGQNTRKEPKKKEPKKKEPKKKSKWRKCSKNYKRGCSGHGIKNLQTQLIRLGFPVGKEGPDGKFGKDTKKAVLDFQKKAFPNKIDEDGKNQWDGIAGSNTIIALTKAAGSSPKKPAPKDKPEESPNPAKEFHKKTSGQVKANDKKGSLSKKEEDDIIREEDEVIEEKHPVGNGPRPVNENQNFLKSRFTRLLKTERS